MLKKGTKFKIKVVKNPLINTKVGNIVEITDIGEKTVCFIDNITHEWFFIEKDKIEEYLEII